MRARKILGNENTVKKTIRINEAMARYSLGRNKMTEVAREARAVSKIGRTILIDVGKMDQYIENMME